MKRATLEDMQKLREELIAQQTEITATVIEDNFQVNVENDFYKVLSKKVSEKKKLTIEEQIEYLKLKGITFNFIKEEDAKNFLTNNSYYYKITAFRKNFVKNSNGKYENIDFGTLNDLATIDMHLRYLLIKLSLDIEHALKTLLIKLITESDEDGYSIVEDYNKFEFNSFCSKIDNLQITEEDKEKKKSSYIPIQQKILSEHKGKRDYSYDLWSKRKDNPSIWVLIEMMSYGQLASFIKFYVDEQKFGSSQLQLAYHYLYFSKYVRDSSAHSRPIILNVIENAQFKSRNFPKPHLKTYLLDASVPKDITNRYLTNLKVHDLCSLLLLHDKYIKGSLARRERKREMRTLLKRARKRKSYYPNIPELAEVLVIFSKIIKNYKLKC